TFENIHIVRVAIGRTACELVPQPPAGKSPNPIEKTTTNRIPTAKDGMAIPNVARVVVKDRRNRDRAKPDANPSNRANPNPRISALAARYKVTGILAARTSTTG